MGRIEGANRLGSEKVGRDAQVNNWVCLLRLFFKSTFLLRDLSTSRTLDLLQNGTHIYLPPTLSIFEIVLGGIIELHFIDEETEAQGDDRWCLQNKDQKGNSLPGHLSDPGWNVTWSWGRNSHSSVEEEDRRVPGPWASGWACPRVSLWGHSSLDLHQKAVMGQDPSCPQMHVMLKGLGSHSSFGH